MTAKPGHDGKIPVYSIVNGQKTRVPPHYMDHPELSKNFRLTPSSKKVREAQANQTSSDTESPDQTPA